MNDPATKLATLRASLRDFGSALVAFSAGVDSTFLLCVAHEMLGDRCVAATVRAPFVPAREFEAAVSFCRELGVEHIVLDADLAAIPHFAENPPDRCYHCKKALFSRLLALASERGLAAVLEGSNIDEALLARVDSAETLVAKLIPDLAQLRVRVYADLARIEVPPADIPRVSVALPLLSSALRPLGFARVEVDPKGYRTGSLNERLPKP